MATEEKQNRRDITDVLFIAVPFLFIFAGYFFGADAHPFLRYLPFYNAFKNMWSLLTMLGIGALNIFSFTKHRVQRIVGGIQSIHSSLWRGFGYAVLLFAYLIILSLSFVWGAAILSSAEDSTPYHDGDITDFDELKSGLHIYITVVLEDGSKPQDPDVQYEVIHVQPDTLPPWKIAVDFPRYLACQVRGVSPTKVTVRPSFPDVVVRFSDPLISYGDETVMRMSNQNLLGDVLTQVQNDYLPLFEYSYDDKTWRKYPIFGTENRLPLQCATVFLRWNNDWELAFRSLLNHQKITAKAGDTVDFYFPGERVELNIDMINQSNASDCALADKLKTVKQYRLSLESVNAQTVHCDSSITINSEISASDLPELPPCIIKTGMEIIYHCYDGFNDLGYYYIVVDHGTMVWEETRLGQKEVVVLRLDMN